MNKNLSILIIKNFLEKSNKKIFWKKHIKKMKNDGNYQSTFD